VRFAAEPLYPVASEQVAIQATVVDESLIEREIARIEEQEQAEILRRQEEERQAREQAEAAQRELEQQQRQLELARQEQEQREQEALVEQQRLAELQQEREVEEQRRLEAQRQAEEAERLRIEEEERIAQQREEEERRRREEEARLEQERLAREAEERRQREEQLAREREEARQRAEMEAELLRAMAAEEERRAAEDAGLLDQYILLIQDRIERAWNPPPSAGPGLQCEVSVTQIPSGDVTSVSVGRCNGDVAVIRSIEQAVQRASPLPPPPTPSLFSRNLELIFQPDA
jgi:colicin import membrane protein